MYEDCILCGVYGWCNDDGVCNDCLEEELDGEDEEESDSNDP